MLRTVCLFVFLFCFSFVNAQNYNYNNDGGKGKSIAFEEPIVEENGKIVKKDSLVQIFRNTLQSRWLSNSAMEIVAIEELERMIKVQMRSQDSRHSDKTAIEAGNFVVELFSAQTTIYILPKDRYSVRIKITNNEKGSVVINWASSEYENHEEFINYAANDVALNVLPKLGVELSSLAKRELSRRKDSDVSLLQAREYLDNLTSSISDLDRQLSEVTKSKMQEVGSVAEKEKIKAQLEQLKIQEKEANARVKRLEEDERRREQDRHRAKSRSEELNKKIAKNGAKYDKLANKKRKEYAKNLSSNARISIFEKKKSGLLGLKEGVIEKIKAYYLQEYEDTKNKIEKIETTPYSIVEKNAKGKVTSVAKKERKEKIKAEFKASKMRKAKYLKEQFDNLIPSFELIRKEIISDIPTLKGQKESSILNPDLLRFGNYDGGKHAWVASISLILAGNILSDEQILIPYKNITGLEPGYKTKEEKEAYNTSVEEYNSYFASNISVIYVEINYDITPISIKKPSQYYVKINSYVFKKIENDEVIYTWKAKSSVKTITITPFVSIDYSTPLLESNIKSEVEAYMKQREKEIKKREAEKKRREKEKQKEGKNNLETLTPTKENSATPSSASGFFENIFMYGYIPLGTDVGFSHTYYSTGSFGLNCSYLFYTNYIDVGPELKMFFTPYQLDFAIAVRVQKKVYENIYVAGGLGLDLFNIKPYVATIFSLESGYIFLENWSVSLKFDISTQPQYLFRFGVNYYFR